MKRMISALLLCVLLLTAALPAFAEGEDIYIDAVHLSDEYKDMLMDSFDRTVLGQNSNVREQLKKILYLDTVTVDAAAYNQIIAAVNKAITTETLSTGATLDAYTESDLAIAAELISEICDALDLDFAIDPSIDSQNEYARVITIKKNGKVLGRINSDAKTDVANPASVLWIVIGGLLLLVSLWLGLWQMTQRRRFEA